MKNNIPIPDGYQDYLYQLTYRLLIGVTPWIPSYVKPNYITVAGFIFAMTGTALLFLIKTPIAYLYWIFFNLMWFILDALDGMHARLTQQTSEYGAFLDHSLDLIYFLFMFTVFVVKFDLTHILYVYIIILRITISALVFVVQCHTRKLYLTKFSGGLEFLLLNAVMLLSYFFPHANPAHWTHHSILLHWINVLDLRQGFFMKIALWAYFIGVPINTVKQFRFANQILNPQRQQSST